ncbi:MAG: activator of Hsp90 ATPase 1 family protein [Bacteroidota bacterium]|nr:activator of Hsp90 ATPase 1 family protein [Bacteroidota bacterium]
MEPGNIPADRQIVSVRAFDATPRRIFKAWTDPTQLAKWWGPKGFTNTFNEFDVKPGGKWNFIMHGPDGANYNNESVFIKITELEIVLDHISNPKFQLVASFEDLGSKTKLTFRQIFNSAKECEIIKVYAVDSNEQNFDRLEALLKQNT